MTDMTPPHGLHAVQFRVAPIPCSCSRPGQGQMCSRCRMPLCHACSKDNGGWCHPCTEAEALSPPVNRKPA